MKKLLAVLAVVMLAAFAAPALAATNPFIDVPASHWAYDAVAQLASRGLISGYPDGTFKGQQPTTRYEIASIIARSLANLDADKASKADVEMMRRLIVEFSDELSALNVTVDAFDGRLGALEADLGGWRLSGVFEFNAKIGSNGTARDIRNAAAGAAVGTGTSASGISGVVDFDLDKYRIFLDRRINETTSFRARIGKDGAGGHSDNDASLPWNWYYITTKLGYDITLDAGRFEVDWEGDVGLVADDDAFVGNVTTQQFRFSRDWGLANLQFTLGRLGDDTIDAISADITVTSGIPDTGYYSPVPTNEAFLVGGLADINFSEKFQAGLIGYYLFTEQDLVSPDGVKELDLGVYAKFKFHPSVELKGIYYYQDREQGISNETFVNDFGANPTNALYDSNYLDDNFNAWKVILKADKELLQFTDLQVEYAQIENGFRLWNAPYASIGNKILTNKPTGGANTTKVLGVRAAQEWGDSRWNTWLRYYRADYGTVGIANVQNFGLGIGYQLNPAVHFELAADYIDFGNATGGNAGNGYAGQTKRYVDEDAIIRFQTVVNF